MTASEYDEWKSSAGEKAAEERLSATLARFKAALRLLDKCAEEAARAAAAETEETEDLVQRRLERLQTAAAKRRRALEALEALLPTLPGAVLDRATTGLQAARAAEEHTAATFERVHKKLGAALNHLDETRDNFARLAKTYGTWHTTQQREHLGEQEGGEREA